MLTGGDICHLRPEAVDQLDRMQPQTAHLALQMSAHVREIPILRSNQVRSVARSGVGLCRVAAVIADACENGRGVIALRGQRTRMREREQGEEQNEANDSLQHDASQVGSRRMTGIFGGELVLKDATNSVIVDVIHHQPVPLSGREYVEQVACVHREDDAHALRISWRYVAYDLRRSTRDRPRARRHARKRHHPVSRDLGYADAIGVFRECAVKARSSSFDCFFCWARSGCDGSERLNGDDMGRLLRYGRRPHKRPEEGAKHIASSEMGAALSADRRRSVRQRKS
jgi:hypothetical protein